MKRIFKAVRVPAHESETFAAALNAANNDGYRIESSGMSGDGAHFWAILSRPARMRTMEAQALSKDDMDIIRAFADNDMSISDTALALPVHRNTLYSRLEAIEKKTGMNPRNFYDLSELLYPDE